MSSAKGARIKPDFDAVVVGAGFAGIYLVHRLRGLGLSVRLYEAGSGPGGTWHWNKYPGAASDIESLEYSYTFSDDVQQEWSWSRRFAHQPEILSYINHVVDRFDLRGHMQFDTQVVAARHDEDEQLWRITTDRDGEVTARFAIMAVGYMSTPKSDEFPGLDCFKGELYRTFGWPEHKVEFGGKRVGVIGTGPSGIQCIPVIAEQAGSLTVFQRTPNFSVSVRNGPMDPAYQERIKAEYHAVRRKERNSQCGIDIWLDPLKIPTTAVSEEEMEAEFERRWEAGGLHMLTSYTDLLFDLEANAKVAEFVRKKIRAKIKDPAVAELLVPKGYAFGSRRVCTDNKRLPVAQGLPVRTAGHDRRLHPHVDAGTLVRARHLHGEVRHRRRWRQGPGAQPLVQAHLKAPRALPSAAPALPVCRSSPPIRRSRRGPGLKPCW